MRVEAEEKIRSMARFDSLTGLANRAYFHELVAETMESRRPKAPLRAGRLRPRRLQERQRHARPSGRRRADLCGRRAACRPLPATGDQGQPLRRRRVHDLLRPHRRREPTWRAMLDDMFAGLQGEVDVAGHALRIQVSAGAVLSRVKRYRRRRHDRQGRSCALQGQGTRQERLAPVRGGDGCRLPQSPDDEGGSAQCGRGQAACASSTSRSWRSTTMRIASCEALCRWDHPELGPISPAIFIPLAEEMGIISEISTLHAPGRLPANAPSGPSRRACPSTCRPRTSATATSSTRCRRALAESGLAPHRLEIEVTETALLDDKSLTRRVDRGAQEASACASRSTISAPAIRASAICTSCRSTRSRSTAAS